MLNFYDFEVFKYDWLVVIINPVRRETTVIINDSDALDRYHQGHKSEIWIGFNSRNYDQWIAKGIICELNPKEINDWIIVKGQKGYGFSRLLNKVFLINYDVMPNPPVGLKTLEGFMGNDIQETSVPFDIDRKLTQSEIDETVVYCTHDVEQTIEVFLHRKVEFDSQMALIKTFNLPLAHIGKTQAQLASIILGAVAVTHNDDWDIRLPGTLRLTQYRGVADWFMDKANHDGKKNLEINVAGVPHTFAWGGVHGAISKYSYRVKGDELLIMADVDQLYPTLMIKYGLLSRAVREAGRFAEILRTSLRLKAEKKKREREPFKRICNITYGTEGDSSNAMFDPLHRTLVCIFGQLLLLDLIEKIEGFTTLIQSNTDGILLKLKRADFDRLDDAVYEWEQRTGLTMSFDYYLAIMQKDVNNYVAVGYDGDNKFVGTYVKALSPIDNDLPIINTAIRERMLNDIPVEKTIGDCDDLHQFQKLVKLSNKYEFVEHNGIKYLNKSYRVFASNLDNDGKILKCKTVVDGIKKDKFANTANRCFIYNESVKGVKPPKKLNKTWYIELAKKRLTQYGIDN